MYGLVLVCFGACNVMNSTSAIHIRCFIDLSTFVFYPISFDELPNESVELVKCVIYLLSFSG